MQSEEEEEEEEEAGTTPRSAQGETIPGQWLGQAVVRHLQTLHLRQRRTSTLAIRAASRNLGFQGPQVGHPLDIHGA